MRFLFILATLICGGSIVHAQEKSKPEQFLQAFSKHQGLYFEGKIIAGAQEGDAFTGKRLLMHVMSWSPNEVKVPFYVGEDKSRTWIFTLNEENLVKLKHDHRLEDGSPDPVTFYGGTSTTVGEANKQMFPADPETCQLIDYACFNVWWVTIEDHKYTYNLRRIGSDRVFSVEFDLSQPVKSDYKPW